jgi:HicB family
MARKRDDTVKLVLRLPPQLHKRLTREATRSNQSLNTEMIQRLEHSLRQQAVRSYPEFLDVSFKLMDALRDGDAEGAAQTIRSAREAWDRIQDDGEKK